MWMSSLASQGGGLLAEGSLGLGDIFLSTELEVSVLLTVLWLVNTFCVTLINHLPG